MFPKCFTVCTFDQHEQVMHSDSLWELNRSCKEIKGHCVDNGTEVQLCIDLIRMILTVWSFRRTECIWTFLPSWRVHSCSAKGPSLNSVNKGSEAAFFNRKKSEFTLKLLNRIFLKQSLNNMIALRLIFNFLGL